MRITAICFLLVWTISALWAQDTYSCRFDFGFPAAVLTSILSTDSCYYATGVIADSIPPHEAGNIFVKFSPQGEVEYQKTIKDTAKSYQTWRNNLKALPWGGLCGCRLYDRQPDESVIDRI